MARVHPQVICSCSFNRYVLSEDSGAQDLEGVSLSPRGWDFPDAPPSSSSSPLSFYAESSNLSWCCEFVPESGISKKKALSAPTQAEAMLPESPLTHSSSPCAKGDVTQGFSCWTGLCDSPSHIGDGACLCLSVCPRVSLPNPSLLS